MHCIPGRLAYFIEHLNAYDAEMLLRWIDENEDTALMQIRDLALHAMQTKNPRIG